MTEYIDKSKLYNAIASREEEYRSALLRERKYNTPTALKMQGLLNAATLIKHMVFDSPSADVKPVVRGEWIEAPDKTCATCSHCKTDWNVFDNDTYRFNFCPNCGADMRKG